jgi:TDG/mug DNA glycosylase family protein
MGTLPGDESIRQQRYYADPSNTFWSLLPAALGTPVGTSYPERLGFLATHRVALWDVLQSAERAGSKDSAIANPKANDFDDLFAKFPGLQRRAFNGTRAETLWRKHIRPRATAPHNPPATTTLPSSSGTPGRHVLPDAEKMARWRDFLRSSEWAWRWPTAPRFQGRRECRPTAALPAFEPRFWGARRAVPPYRRYGHPTSTARIVVTLVDPEHAGPYVVVEPRPDGSLVLEPGSVDAAIGAERVRTVAERDEMFRSLAAAADRWSSRPRLRRTFRLSERAAREHAKLTRRTRPPGPREPHRLPRGPFRFFFFSREEPRLHIHVSSADGEPKFWLNPSIELARNHGLADLDVRRASEAIQRHEEEIRDAWIRHFGNWGHEYLSARLLAARR